jgi:hypothetical protein
MGMCTAQAAARPLAATHLLFCVTRTQQRQQQQQQGKLIMRAAAKLAPAPVLSSVGPLQQQCLSVATSADSAAAAAAAGGMAGVS